jgi:hypothetical protein
LGSKAPTAMKFCSVKWAILPLCWHCMLWNVHFLFLVWLEFELKTSHSQSRHSTAWGTPPVCIALVVLEMGSCKLFA